MGNINQVSVLACMYDIIVVSGRLVWKTGQIFQNLNFRRMSKEIN